jgi:hypothetical protein
MQAFEVPGQTDQTPLTRRCGQAAQRKLAKAQHLLDDTNDWFDGTFALAVNRSTDVSLQFIGHLDDGTGLGGRGLRGLGKKLAPTVLMGFRPVAMYGSMPQACKVLMVVGLK